MPRKRKKSKKSSKPEFPVTVTDFDRWVKDEAERTGKSEAQIIEEVFGDGFLVWAYSGSADIEEAGKIFGVTTEKETDLIAECKRLRKEFAPVSTCVDYLRDSILGGGISIVIDDPNNSLQKEIKEYVEKFMEDIYQDDYTQGLDVLRSILVDEALTTGVGAAEIVYGKDINFFDYATPLSSTAKVGSKEIEYIMYETKEPDWENLGGITRLKILNDAYKRLKAYRDPQSWEIKYWTLDENLSKRDVIKVGDVELRKLVKPKQKVQAVYFHPWQIFKLTLKRKGFEEGQSVILPVVNIARILEKIIKAVGEGIHRAGNRKFFIVCGTEKRPWSAAHIRNVMQQLREASKKNWSVIPVPQGFDVKSIGGEVFDASDVIDYMLRMIARGMNVPLSVLGLSIRNDIKSTYKIYKNMLENAVRHQLVKRHIWCKYGRTRTKKGGKAEEPTYIPRVRVKAEDLLTKREKLDMLVAMLNVANPVRPEVKLAIEEEICKIMGWDEVLLPTQEELKVELEKLQEQEKKKKQKKEEKAEKKKKKTEKSEEERKEEEKEIPKGTKAQGKPVPQTEERAKKKLEGMQKQITEKKKKARPMGSTRIPKEVKETK